MQKAKNVYPNAIQVGFMNRTSFFGFMKVTFCIPGNMP
jgi:hypothetical protein